MLNVGGPELLIILLVALIFLGPQRLPEVARQLGQAVSSLKSMAAGFQAELEAASRPDPDRSMRLDGPTSTDEAIARTQPGANAAAIGEAARKVSHDQDTPPVAEGGPTDLRNGAAVSPADVDPKATSGAASDQSHHSDHSVESVDSAGGVSEAARAPGSPSQDPSAGPGERE